MTPAQYAKLVPGDIIRRRIGTRPLRIVVSQPGRTQYGAITGLGLVKIGHSWTDPNPTAWYDKQIVLAEYSVTGARGMSREHALALRWWNVWHMAEPKVQRLAAKRFPEQFAAMLERLRTGTAPYLLNRVVPELR